MNNEERILKIAQAAHEVNRAYCQSMGDDSQVSWGETPQWQKDSAVCGVELHLNNPEAGPEASHKSWLKQKENDGWKFGKIKDAEKKEHPCMLPFERLPYYQQAKDYIFRAVVLMGVELTSVEAKSCLVD